MTSIYVDDPLALVNPPGPANARALRVEPPLYIEESAAADTLRIYYSAQGLGMLSYNLDLFYTRLMPATPIISYDET